MTILLSVEAIRLMLGLLLSRFLMDAGQAMLIRKMRQILVGEQLMVMVVYFKVWVVLLLLMMLRRKVTDVLYLLWGHFPFCF